MTMNRVSWNFFVGDSEFLTDTWLKFISPILEFKYEKFVVGSSLPSQPFICIALLVVSQVEAWNESAWAKLLSFIAFGLSLSPTLKEVQ